MQAGLLRVCGRTTEGLGTLLIRTLPGAVASAADGPLGGGGLPPSGGAPGAVPAAHQPEQRTAQAGGGEGLSAAKKNNILDSFF